ncbi:MAG: CHASE2 domain-containing protein [Leptolyngbya sp. SIO1D8]|nr:CHASE2 domain-containing protein [Leptolyngbya sp. SIO1D8]
MPNSATATQSKTQSTRRWFQPSWQRLATSTCLALVAGITSLNSPFLQRWERQTQTFFFELRGPQVAPEDIVILAIDDESLSQVEHYQSDPERYASLAPIQQWPWQRIAYAIAIERLMEAGAKSVSLDIVLPTESAYGPADDEALTSVLERYGDRVTLAMKYENSQIRQGFILKPTLPLPQFQDKGIHLGNINFPLEVDGRIHHQGHTYLQTLEQSTAELDEQSQTEQDWENMYSFAEATLKAAQVPYENISDTYIHFLGPARTFQHIPFWYILDPDPWQNYLDSGAIFKDKIVLVGSTASLHQDFHPAPFSKTLLYPEPLAGVEILANDIATLQAGNYLQQAIPSSGLKGGLVLLIGAGFASVLRRSRRTLQRLGWTTGLIVGWVTVSYVSFISLGWVLPTASVTMAIVVVGSSHMLVSLITEKIRKQRLRQTLAQYVTSPIVQEIISQEEEFQDLLEARQAQVVGSLLGGRYQVLEILGSGGFSETYTAQDTQRPGQPTCVVKQLKIISDDPKAHELAHRLFLSEADTLERLGHHHQIPRLLAHFDTNSAFYLVEEMVQGTTIKTELEDRQPKSQAWAMNFLLDILPVVDFVHSQGVIHRDIKPSNLIRRAGDGRLVMIDFGSVKQISNRLTDTEAQVTSTVGIGTKGYMPSEQSAGLPRFSSDLYAVGVTVIEALTGLSPYKMAYDDRGELIWQYKVPNLNPALANVLNKMVRYDFSRRYDSAAEVLAALKEIPVTLPDSILNNGVTFTSTLEHTSDDEDRWDEPTGFLPTDWMTNSIERPNSVSHTDSTSQADTEETP